MCAPVAPSGAALTPCSSRVSRARERAVWRSGAARCGPRVRLTGRGLFCCSGAGILLRTQEAVSSAPSAGGALPWGLESSRWGAVLSCRCLIPFLSRPPALPDSFSKNKSPSPPPSLALSQLSSQGGEVGVKAPLELPRAAARGPGGGVVPGALRPLLMAFALWRAWAWPVMLTVTLSFSAGFPFYQIKSALLFILNIYLFKKLFVSGGVQHLLAVACGVLFPDQESHLGPCIGSTESWSLDHQGRLCLFIFMFLFLSVLGLRYWAGFPLVLLSGGCSLTAVGPLITVVSCYRAWALGHLSFSN